nr:restriction endonuclease subunit S [Deinococcus sp. GbtcB9]
MIPEDWDIISFAQIFDIKASGDLNKLTFSKEKDGKYKYPIYANATSKRGLYGYTSEAKIPSNTLTVTARGDLGHAFYRNEAYDAIGRLLTLAPISPIDPRFFVDYINNFINIVSESTGVPQLTAPQFGRYICPLPPLPEQHAIASALADVDALLDSLEDLLTKKRQLKQATMQELLTGKTRLEGFEGEWEEKRLGKFGQCIRGVTYQPELDLRDGDTSETKRLLRANNIQGGLINLHNVQYVNYQRVSDEQLLKADDILICMANGSRSLVGKAGMFRPSTGYEYTFGAFMACYRLNGSHNSDSSFIRFIFESKKYRDQIDLALAGSTINNLSPKSIENLKFSFPPLPEQKAIAVVLSEMDAELEALEERLSKTRDLKQGMMQELLTGRTRLI